MRLQTLTIKDFLRHNLIILVYSGKPYNLQGITVSFQENLDKTTIPDKMFETK